MVGNGRNARPTAPTAVLCETECYVVLGTAGLPFSGFVCSALYECSNMASISPSPPRIPFIITEKQKKMRRLFLSTPSAFLSPWQHSSFLIMRKLNLLVPKQRGNKSHAHLGPWVSVTRLASWACQEQTRGGQAHPQDHCVGLVKLLSRRAGQPVALCAC